MRISGTLDEFPPEAATLALICRIDPTLQGDRHRFVGLASLGTPGCVSGKRRVCKKLALQLERKGLLELLGVRALAHDI